MSIPRFCDTAQGVPISQKRYRIKELRSTLQKKQQKSRVFSTHFLHNHLFFGPLPTCFPPASRLTPDPDPTLSAQRTRRDLAITDQGISRCRTRPLETSCIAGRSWSASGPLTGPLPVEAFLLPGVPCPLVDHYRTIAGFYTTKYVINAKHRKGVTVIGLTQSMQIEDRHLMEKFQERRDRGIPGTSPYASYSLYYFIYSLARRFPSASRLPACFPVRFPPASRLLPDSDPTANAINTPRVVVIAGQGLPRYRPLPVETLSIAGRYRWRTGPLPVETDDVSSYCRPRPSEVDRIAGRYWSRPVCFWSFPGPFPVRSLSVTGREPVENRWQMLYMRQESFRLPRSKPP